MNLGLGNTQKIYLGEQEVSKIVLQNFEVFSSVPDDPWSSVLNSSYESNIVAAYDFRDGSGSIIPSKIGPELVTTGSVTFDTNGANFQYLNTHAESNTTISISYPQTLVFVAKADVSNHPSGDTTESVLLNCQKTKWIQTSNEMVQVFSRGFQSFMPYNGNDNQQTGYKPNGTEWYFVACSFLNDNTVRYAIRKSSGNLNGIVPGNANKLNFSGFVSIAKGYSDTNFRGFNGPILLSMFINQAFSTEQEMNDLFDTIVSGPAQGIPLT